MNKAKALLIPVAAFAVTVTGAHAFNTTVLEEAGLNDDQITAFEQAHELRKEGDREAAKQVIIDAGIDADTLDAVREAMKEDRKERRTAIHAALDSEDYLEFLSVADGSPILDIITSEDDFDQLVEAHKLREAGEKDAAKEIMEDLGFERKHENARGYKGEPGERGAHKGSRGHDS